MEDKIKNFIKTASPEELRQYLELLKAKTGYEDLVQLITFILENVDKTS